MDSKIPTTNPFSRNMSYIVEKRQRARDRVTDKMRAAARAYWMDLHPDAPLIPIGEINGIIYAALEAE